MPAGIAEHLAEQTAGAVDDSGLPGERRCTGDEAHHLHDPADAVEVADLRPDRGDGVERTYTGEVGGLLRIDLGTDLAGGGQLTVDERKLAGRPDEVSRPDSRHVGGDGLRHRWQAEAELGESRGNPAALGAH